MNKKIRRFFGILLSLTGIIWGGTISFAASTSCPLIAPESCYTVNPSGAQYSESWKTSNKPNYCTTTNPAQAHSINFSKNFTDKNEICKDLGVSCSGQVSVSEIQNKIRKTAKYLDWDKNLSKSVFGNYNTKYDLTKNTLPYSQWGANKSLDCDKNGFLTDGKYGYCTQFALQLYLDRKCVDKTLDVIIIGNGLDEKDEDLDDLPNTLKIHKPEATLGSGSCKDLVVTFDKKSGNSAPLAGDNTKQFCQVLTQSDTCNITDPNILGNSSLLEPTNDYSKAKTALNKKLEEACGYIVIGGDSYDKPDGSLHDCENKATMVFSPSGIPQPLGQTSDMCKKLGISFEECTLNAITKRLDSVFYGPEKYKAIAGSLSSELTKDCQDGLYCPGKDTTFQMPHLTSENSTLTKFPSPEICNTIELDSEDCTLEKIRGKINEANKNNIFWNKNFTVKGVPKKFNEESDCSGNAPNKKHFDACTRQALSKFILADKCTPCDKSPQYTDENYPAFQQALAEGTAKTPCECGGEELWDPESFQCVKAFFDLDEDQLRPKYLSGANWEDRKYTGDARDITFWLQKLGGKITNYIAALAVLFMVYNGFMIVTAAGDEDQIRKAKQGIMWTAAGLVLLAFSYVIIKTVISLAY